MNPSSRVSFSVNACNADAPYLDQTLRHMLRQLAYPFVERVVTYDPGRQEGKYAERIQGTQSEVERVLAGLLADGVIDRVDTVPWTAGEQQRVLAKYFGEAEVDLKDFSGAPIYQYLYALDRCTGEYVFHADSDMLFYREGDRSWIEDGLDFLRQQSNALVVTPKGGPPQARNWLERLVGRPLGRAKVSAWHPTASISTRKFLMDKTRLAACLPLVQLKPGEPLEDTLSHSARLAGLMRWSQNDASHYSIHPWKHDENFIRHLDDLIWAVEHNVYPFRRTGFQWDMRTEGEHIHEWLAVLRQHGRGRG